MTDYAPEPIAIVGVSAIMPDAPDTAAFWRNIREGRYSVTDVPPGRWDADRYYDPDPRAPLKTYSRIGAWVREFPWDPVGWRLPLPPTVVAQLDDGQKWAVAAARSALLDAGWPGWGVDPQQVAVIIGNALGGEKHYVTNLHIENPEFIRSLTAAPAFAALPAGVRAAVLAEAEQAFHSAFPGVTEDTMPGELANVVAGRVANVFNLRGPNFITDAACASALAATAVAVRGLQAHDFDAAITGGVDRNMGVAAFVKFCKIGALSATGTRPFDAGADGFVMGEGAALFVLKRLSDAERAGDRIYAVLLNIGGSSDGRGKGITAPNPVGQRLAVERAWDGAGIPLAYAGAVEAHGTSTRVGDAAELDSLTEVFAKGAAAPGTIALGSVKSNIGHLKAAAGAAGLFKMVLSLHDKMLAPSLHFDVPNPNVDWAETPFQVTTELREWPEPHRGMARSGGVSAFGFGGTNFHVVLEEHVPGRYRRESDPRSFAVAQAATQPDTRPSTVTGPATVAQVVAAAERRTPLRGAAIVGGGDEADVAYQLDQLRVRAQAGNGPAPQIPDPGLAAAAVRVAIDYADGAELAAKADKAASALRAGNPAIWRLLRAQGVFFGRGRAPKVAFLYTGQGSQYANMLSGLRDREPIVARAFDHADRIMTPLLGRPLSAYLFVNPADPDAVAAAEQQLLQTEITQPAVLTVDLALTELLAARGIRPDMVMGHSLGEYGALVAAGALSFDAALEAVSARGREMAHLAIADNGAMAAVFGPLARIEHIVADVDGYVVIANINSTSQAVIGGATAAVGRAVLALREAGLTARPIPVSHAFHTAIVAPVSGPLTDALRRLEVRPPQLPVVSNVTGQFYPAGADVPQILDLLGRQVASPVRFVDGLRSLYAAGARVFVEVGPKKALHGFVEDVLGTHDDVLALFTNHPKVADEVAFNHALCGLYAAGLGLAPQQNAAAPAGSAAPEGTDMTDDRYTELGRLFAGVLEQGLRVYQGGPVTPVAPPAAEPVVITGASLGLPGVEHVFDDANVARILAGQQFIDTIPSRLRKAMVDHHITRLVKAESGSATFETIDREADVVKLAGRHAPLDVVADFGVDPARDVALDTTTRLAIGAGFDALRDAGIPLVMRYRTTTLGTRLPDRWGLPDALRDDTGVIFASAFPGFDNFADELERYFTDRGRREHLAALEGVRARMGERDPAAAEVERRIAETRQALADAPYTFDRRFLFRVLSMGHSQFAEIIGARGPNTQINAACSSTTQAIGLAQDWIRAGRCRRVVIVSADDVTSDRLLPWVASGFLASGAAATDDVVEDAATPFDRRRHGMIIGTGAAALIVESAAAARERGIQPICEVLGVVTANSAYHGTRLDVDHIGQVMENLVRQVEAQGVDRHAIAEETVFVSHETYTPARGGSAAAEINALRQVFGSSADSIVITNTKGFTGHAMAAGIEDVVAVKALETGIVPPVPNFKEVDPELGPLNLALGGAYPVRYALRLAAGFGSQIAMALLRWTSMPGRVRPVPTALGYAGRIADPRAWQRWLDAMSGHPDARLEIVQRRLRVVDGAMPPTNGVPVREAVPVMQTVPLRPAPAVAVPAAAVPAVAVPGLAVPVATSPTASTSDGPAIVPTAADAVTAAVVEIVSGLTGYPPELLDLDLDLEADLGVDTVKQAEVFAAVRERFAMARDEALRVRDFPTLSHVIAWIRDKAAVAEPTTGEPTTGEPTTSGPRIGEPAIGEPATLERASAGHGAADADEVTSAVVQIVSGLTGYPPELLDLDLDLEADLGVDTVKQAEVFAAVRERFAIGRDEALRVRDFPTLSHVIAWIGEQTAAPAATVDIETVDIAASQAVAPQDNPVAANGFPRRVPVAAIRPPLASCAETGVVLGPGNAVVVMPDEGGVGEALAARLRKAGVEVLVLDSGLDADALVKQLGDTPVDGVYWLPALDDEGSAESLDHAAWQEALRRRVGLLFATMRHLYALEPFLITATRLGGRHGYDDAGASCPMGGAVTGFAKAYRKECPEALVKAVDFPLSRKTAGLAGLLLDETLRDPDGIEVGYADGRRWGVALTESDFGGRTGGLELGPETTFVVTGAAGSIVSAITADLAAASKGTFHLLDLTAHPDPDDPDLRLYRDDPAALKLRIAQRLRDRGDRPTPVLIDQKLAGYERLQAALAAIKAVESAGGTAHYHSVDLTDPDATAEALAEVRSGGGGVDVLLHAAGIEVSHALPDKPAAEFDRVFGVKAGGWFSLLHALAGLPIGAVVAFSSVAGRFGNTGQTDYSAANDLLAKMISGLRRSRPQTRGLALDWTAWGGIGMATRGSIPKIMAAAGVETLPPEVGVEWIRHELTAGPFSGEVVVAGALGQLAAEPDEGTEVKREALSGTPGPMIGRLSTTVHSGLIVRTELDPMTTPFLDHHRIDGTPVLPGVMGMEAFVEAARLLVPDRPAYAVEDLEFRSPVKFQRDKPRTLTVSVLVRAEGTDLVADCALSAQRVLPGSDQPHTTVHFTGKVRFGDRVPEPQSQVPPALSGPVLDPADIYRLYFHGPAYQVLAEAGRAGSAIVGRFAANLPAQHDLSAGPVVAGPRLVELCLQTAGLWEAGRYGRLALPRRIGRLTLLGQPAEAENLVAVVEPAGQGFDAVVLDGTGQVVLRLEDYRTAALPEPIADGVRTPIRAAMAGPDSRDSVTEGGAP